MSDATLAMLLLAGGTYLLKAAGPLVLGGRSLPPKPARFAEVVPAALLAALVVVATIADGESLVIDARAAGVAAAGVVLWRRAPFVVVVSVAIAVTAALRALH